MPTIIAAAIYQVHGCFQNKPSHQLRFGAATSATTGAVANAGSTAGAAAASTIGPIAGAAAYPSLALPRPDAPRLPCAFSAILLPISPESTAFRSGQNRHVASAVVVPMANSSSVPAVRISARYLCRSARHSARSLSASLDCREALLCDLVNARCAACSFLL